jgi:2-polyprenyl-3-methyl-5-hydroxy-6-metoxy-1,4-benzoquinol methylase
MKSTIRIIGKDNQYYNLIESELGYLHVENLPDGDMLKAYYSQKYFQNPEVATYSKEYTEDEMDFFDFTGKIADYLFNLYFPKSKKYLYDVGCGEGFFLKSLRDLDWNISGVDFSSIGIERHNSDLIDFVRFGDAIKDIELQINNNSKFNLINLDNVLEHVAEPLKLLEKLRQILDDDGLIRIEVPNDNSKLQGLLQRQGSMNLEWVHPPDHLSYFNFENLPVVLEASGFKVVNMLADFPIELFLSNEYSNYVHNPIKGMAAHESRVMISKLIYQRGLENYIKWSEGVAAAGIGRTCIAFASLK